MSFKNQNELIGGVNEIIGGLNASRTKANLKKLKKLEKMDFKFLDQTGGKIMKETLNMLHENYDKECDNKPALLKKNYITSIRKQSLGGGGPGVTRNGDFTEAMKEVLDMVGGGVPALSRKEKAVVMAAAHKSDAEAALEASTRARLLQPKRRQQPKPKRRQQVVLQKHKRRQQANVSPASPTLKSQDLDTLHDELSEYRKKLVELEKACGDGDAAALAGNLWKKVTVAWESLKKYINPGAGGPPSPSAQSREISASAITKLSIGGDPGLDTAIKAAVEACVNYRENKNCEKLRQLKVDIKKKEDDAKFNTQYDVEVAAGEVDAANTNREQAANVVTGADQKVTEANDAEKELKIAHAAALASVSSDSEEDIEKVYRKASQDAASKIEAAKSLQASAVERQKAVDNKHAAAKVLKEKADALHEANSNALKAPSAASHHQLKKAKAAHATAVTAHTAAAASLGK